MNDANFKAAREEFRPPRIFFARDILRHVNAAVEQQRCFQPLKSFASKIFA